MQKEIDLLKNYPKTKRNLQERASNKTDKDRELARRFGKEFFDGDRSHGYGGFSYMSRFWEPVIPDFVREYELTSNSSVLDVGCAKGFMLYDLSRLVPGISVKGVDVSEYAVANGKEEIRDHLMVANAVSLPFQDHSFDLVVSINTVHNLEGADLERAIMELQRVSKGKCFLTVDAYRTEEEKEAMYAWNLTAKTILHVDEWKALFAKIGYIGDYYWFMP